LYGDWSRPGGLSVRGVGWRRVLLAAGGYYTGIVVLQSAPVAGLAVLAVCAVVTLLGAVRVQGATPAQALAHELRWLLAVRAGDTRFDAVHTDRWRLPGPLARTRLVAVAAPGFSGSSTFGVVHDVETRRVAVALALVSTAADLTEPGQHHADVRRWERWLEALGHRDDIAQVTTTVPKVLLEANPAPFDAENEPWPGGTMHQLSTVGIEVMCIIDQVTARMPTTVEAQLWGLPEGIPLLFCRRASLDGQNRTIEISDALYPADRTELQFVTQLTPWRDTDDEPNTG
jgi:hypothetical protein